jgi:alanine dehydrogenase
VLLINNDDARELLTAESCIGVLERAYTDWGHGHAAQFPEGGRMDLGCPSPGNELHRRFTWGAMAGVLPREGVFAVRQKFDINFDVTGSNGHRTVDKFSVKPGTYCGFIILASTENAEPLAIMNDGIIQHLRVGATAAVAAKHLARTDASTLGIIGSGEMAVTHAAALCAVRSISQIRVFSPTVAHRERFALETQDQLGIPTTPVESPREAVRNADIVAFCTNSHTPVFDDCSWVENGMHCTNIRGQDEVGALADCVDRIVLHQHGGAIGAWSGAEGVPPIELSGAEAGGIEQSRADLPALADVLAGRSEGRHSAEEITYFHNRPGAGLQFAAVGAELLRRARASGAGTEIPTEWFLQDIRD